MNFRPVRPSDHPAINRLHREVWWPERSHGAWRWLETNPARHDIAADAGWVVEDDAGEPAAFLGNFIQRFWLGDRLFHGATGFSLVVSPPAHGSSRDLLQAFIDQPRTFARYVFNANARSCGLYGRFGLQAWPPRTHALKLSWSVDRTTLIQGRLLREAIARLPGLIVHQTERFINPRLIEADRLILAPGVDVLSDLGDVSPYADFWNAIRAEGRLIADRGPAMLRWRLQNPDLTLRPVLLVFRRGDAVTGFAMAMMSKGSSIEPPVLEVIDLIALREETRAIPALMHVLLRNARALGAAKVRLQTVTESLLARLGPLARNARHEGGWGHCHVAFTDDAPEFRAWSPTPFDGDYGICLRSVPPQTGAVIGPTGRRAI